MKRDFEGFEVDFGSGSAADGGDAWEHMGTHGNTEWE
jgi:hypothetical protein